MSLLNRLLHYHRNNHSSLQIVPEPSRPLEAFLSADEPGLLRKKAVRGGNFRHRCLVEELEKRELLAVDCSVAIGAVYLEQGDEADGDKFYVTWTGGEESTSLAQLTIDLGKSGYFDTTAAVPGAGNDPSYVAFQVIDEGDNFLSLADFDYYFDGDTNNHVGNGASTLTIVFHTDTDGHSTFTSGETLAFIIDVDRVPGSETDLDTTRFAGIDVDVAGVTLSAVFNSDHFEMKSGETALGTYKNAYTFDDQINLLPDYGYEGVKPDITDNGNKTAGFETIVNLDPKPIEISGYVYADHIKNCRYDVTLADEPISGVSVTLYVLDETTNEFVIATQDGQNLVDVTDENGFYSFEGLLPGTYQVISQGNIPFDSNYFYTDSCARDGDSDQITNDPLIIDKGELLGGTKSENNNFGKVLKGSIEGNVFEDRNDNGVFDRATEDGIANVTIGLYYLKADNTYGEVLDENGKAITTTTNAEGFYRFDDLAVYDKATGTLFMTYAIREIQPIEYQDGKDHVGTVNGVQDGQLDPPDAFDQITIGWGEHGIDYDFGELLPASIEGNVFEDRNDNGVFDRETESGIEGVTIGLYYFDGNNYVAVLDDNGDALTVKTDKNGNYCFDNLDINLEYAVKELTEPGGYSDGQNHVGEVYEGESASGETRGVNEIDEYGRDTLSAVELKWNENGKNYDFGELKLGSVAGYVFADYNNNGEFETAAGDFGLKGVTIGLYYKVGDNYVTVLDASGNALTTTTNADGYYEFTNLDINHDYAIKELTEPADYSDGKNHVGEVYEGTSPTGETRGQNAVDEYGKDYLTDITIGWDENGMNYNFGEIKPGSISGHVFADYNDNGVFETSLGEIGLAGTTVGLYYLSGNSYVAVTDQNGNAVTAKTDADGYYLFDGLDIGLTYGVKELTEPSGYSDGQNHVGEVYVGSSTTGETRGKNVTDSYGKDYLNGVEIGWEENGKNYDFGELQLASISGHVFVDTDDDGYFDSDEEGIAGVTITLTSGSLRYTTTTNSVGYYEFTGLKIDQTWTLVETQPDGYDDGKDHVGTVNGVTVGTLPESDRMTNITLGWADKGINYDFGEIIPPEPEPEPDPDPEPGYNIGVNLPLQLPSRYIGSPASPFNYIPSSVATAPVTTTRYGGGGATPSYSWHLSVLNGGYPRSIEALGSVAGFRGLYGRNDYVQVSWSDKSLDRGIWLIRGENNEIAQRLVFGVDGAIPVTGDWNGDGRTNIGVYVNGRWCLDRNGDGVWDTEDLWAELGSDKDQPVTGDWDGDGKEDIGIFGPRWTGDALAVSLEPGLPADRNPNTFATVSRPKNVPPEYNDLAAAVRVMKHRSAGEVRLDLIDHVFEYGQEGDKAVAGDWTGDGVSKIGVFRGGNWFIDANGNGVWDDGDVMITGFGSGSSIPVVGDWNSDGIDEIGIFEDGLWSLDTNGDYKPDQQFAFGQAGDRPATGDFNGDGKVEFAVYRDGGDGQTGEEPTASGDGISL